MRLAPPTLIILSVNRLADTIAAIATAPGEGAICVVRLSGPDSLAIADRIFRCRGAKPSERPGNTFVYGHIVRLGGEPARGVSETLDEVIMLIFRAPHSYTREDVVEIQGHGGGVCARRILETVLEAGARLAEPGEFTKRAFLNGRIDLVQAEAVVDLIRARSDRAAAAAIEQLDGHLSTTLAGTYDLLLGVSAEVEAALDFSEEEVPCPLIEDCIRRLGLAWEQMQQLLDTWNEGHLLRDGALVVISGRPNAGKSTLFNVLLGRDRAIVTHLPGTTRDVIEETVLLDGFPIRLADTAGLRDTECQIETEGIRRARDWIERADVNLHVVDASVSLTQEDCEQLKGLNPDRAVVILNKADLGLVVQPQECLGLSAVVCSLLSGSGVDVLRAVLLSKLHAGPSAPPHASISERHRQGLISAQGAIVDAIGLLRRGEEGIAFAASKMREAIESIGTILGRVYAEDVLESIFSRFCIGK